MKVKVGENDHGTLVGRKEAGTGGVLGSTRQTVEYLKSEDEYKDKYYGNSKLEYKYECKYIAY